MADLKSKGTRINSNLNGCDYISIVSRYLLDNKSSEQLTKEYKCRSKKISYILELCNLKVKIGRPVYDTKVCKECNQSLNKEENYKKTKSGKHNSYRARCNKCDEEYQYQRWLRDKDRLMAQRKARAEANPEYFIAKEKAYRQKYKDEGRVYNKNYVRNPEKANAAMRKYRALDSTKAKRREYMAKKWREMTPAQKMCENVKKAVHKALKSKKDNRTFVLIGYQTNALIAHIESLFTDGMNWDNYGKDGWHLDHIIPKAYFNLEDKEEFKKAWALENLQPLWAAENSSKNSNYNGTRYYYNK